MLEAAQEKFVRAVADKDRDHPGFLDNLPRDGKFADLFNRAHPACHFLNMLRDPSYVIPPPAFTDDGDAVNSDPEGDEGEGPIGKAGRERFAAILRGLTTARESVARAMAFAIEHTASADEVRKCRAYALTA